MKNTAYSNFNSLEHEANLLSSPYGGSSYISRSKKKDLVEKQSDEDDKKSSSLKP